jgi:Immunity protein 53
MIKNLQSLLTSLSDGKWEHGHGIALTSLDNPGWHFDLSLHLTRWENLFVPEVFVDRSECDWIHIKTEVRGFENYLTANCGPENLEETMTKVFDILNSNDTNSRDTTNTGDAAAAPG